MTCGDTSNSISLVGKGVSCQGHTTHAVLGSSSAARVFDSNVPDPWAKASMGVSTREVRQRRYGLGLAFPPNQKDAFLLRAFSGDGPHGALATQQQASFCPKQLSW